MYSLYDLNDNFFSKIPKENIDPDFTFIDEN